MFSPHHSRSLRALWIAFALATGTVLRSAPADFTVESVPAGKTFRLSKARGSYVVLHFLLKTECPVCLLHVQRHARQATNLPGVVQIFLKPDSTEEILRWTGRLPSATNTTSTPIVIYRDPDAGLAREFEIPDGYEFHGERVHYPALLILDPNGREVFRKIGKNNTDRMSPDQLAAELQKLKAKE